MDYQTFLRHAVVATSVAAALMLAGAYVLMARPYPRRYLRWWALGWLGHALYQLSSALALVLRNVPHGLPASVVASFLGQWGGWLAAFMLPLGAWAILKEEDDLRRPGRVLVATAALLGLVSTFGVPLVDPAALDARFLARVGIPRTVAAGCAFAAAWFLRRASAARGVAGYRWTWRILVLLGLFWLHYGAVGIVGPRSLGDGIAPLYLASLPLFDVLLVAALGVATGLALVEDDARRVAAAAEQRLEAERRANRSVESLVSALSAIPDQVVVLDGEGRVVAWNAAFEDFMRRYGHATIGGRDFVELLPEERRPDWRAYVADLMAGGELRFDSSYVPAGAEAHAEFDVFARGIREGDTVTGAVIVCRDVTARRALETRLQQTQRLDTVGRLAGGIAHDFNNLLTAILGSTSMARESLPPHHEAQADLGDVQLAAERAAQLTRQLLAFARRHPVSQEPIDVGERVSAMERMLSRLVGPAVQLRVRLAEGLWPVRADAAQLEQVIVNLVVNARDAMPSGGTLTIRTENRRLEDGAQGDLFPRPVPAGEYVEITVRDTGTGMDAATLAHAFEPFFTTKPVGQGTGLGLAMCYGIIRQQNGVIWIESEPGRGSTVHIMFPRFYGALEPRHEPLVLEPTPIRVGTETVLVVEDEPQVRAVAARTLRGAGYRVLEATNGRDGVQVARREKDSIDLVLTDIVMPEMGGREMMELVRQYIPRATVLYISGFTAGGLPVAADEREQRHFLQKPFTPVVLLDRVRVLLDERVTGERPVPVPPG